MHFSEFYSQIFARLSFRRYGKLQKGMKKVQAKRRNEDDLYALWMKSYPLHIAKAFQDIPGYNFREWIKWLDVWNKHHYALVDAYPCIDVIEENMNVLKSCRLTIGQPLKAKNTVYMVGSDIAFGKFVFDEQTSSSFLQRYCNTMSLDKYAVVNLGFAERNTTADIIKCCELQLIAGDFIVLQVDYQFLNKDTPCTLEALLSIHRLCQRAGATFIVLAIPGANLIVNPSDVEKSLSSLTYQALMAGKPHNPKADGRRVWAPPFLFNSLAAQGVAVEDLTPYFARPHPLGEIYMDKLHLFPNAHEEIARVIFENFIAPNINCQDNFAEKTMHSLSVDEKEAVYLMNDNFAHAVALIYIADGRYLDARRIIEKSLALFPSARMYNRALHLGAIIGDVTWCEQIEINAGENGYKPTPAYGRKIQFLQKDIKEIYLSFKVDSYSLANTPLEKIYTDRIDEIRDRKGQALIIAQSGPGDEIRFAKMYSIFSQYLSDCNVVFLCEPRLLSLMERSMPAFKFYSSRRIIRQHSQKKDLKHYNLLPNQRLAAIFDNDTWQMALESQSVSTCSELIGSCIDGHASLDGKSYLLAAPDRVSILRQRLTHIKKPLVGICWRSSIVNYLRIEHYLLIDEIMDLFAIDGVQFVNLQSDVYQWELDKVEEKYPGRLIHFSDIDQFNDFETTAALMECLDLVISVPSGVIELAGALGRPGWFLVNSAEMYYRKNPLRDNRDLWHDSVEIVQGAEPGVKSTLVEALVDKLKKWGK